MNDILGIDIGYGYTKTYRLTTGKKKFPTLIASHQVGSNSFGGHRQKITVNDEDFFVGNNAEKMSGWSIDTRTSGFIGSNAWLAVIGKAIAINNIVPADMDGMKLVFGLPPGLYTEKSVQNLTEIIKNTHIDFSGREYWFNRTTVGMIPQGAGIYFAYLRSMSDKPDEVKKTIAIVDIGHYTVDTVMFSGGEYMNAVIGTGSLPWGISILLDRIRTEFSQLHGRFINSDVALRLLVDGKVSIFQQEYTLDMMDQLIKAYASQISTHIEKFFAGEMSADVGVLAGGGILALQKYLDMKNKVLIMSEPDMANVMGYWDYGLNMQ